MRIVLITLTLVLGLVAALLAALPWLAEPALRTALRLAGQDIGFEHVQVGWDNLEIKGIALGQGDQQLAALRVDYHWSDLLDGRLERIEIDGLVVRAAWHDGQLRLNGFHAADQATDGGAIPLPDVAEVAVRDARIELSTELGVLQLPFAAQLLQVGDLMTFAASIDDAGIDGIKGTLLADLALEGELPREPPITLDAVRASGIIDVVADGASVGIAQGVAGEVRLGFDLTEGQLQLESSDLALTLAGLAGLAEGADVASVVPPPWQVVVGEGGPLSLRADLASGTIALSGPVALASGGPRAELQLDLALVRDASGLSLAPSTASVAIFDGAWQGASIADARIELAGQGDAKEARGSIDLALQDAALATADLALSGATLHQRMTWTYATDALTVQADGAGTLAIASLIGTDLEAGPLQLRLEPGERPLLELSLDQGQPAAWQHTATAVIESAALHLAAPTPLDLESGAGAVALTLDGVGQSLSGAEIGVSGGQLRLPQHGLALEGIATEVGLTSEGLVQGQPVPITVARLRQGSKPAWFAPLTLAATLVPGAESMAFEADLSRIGGGLTLGVRGEHRFTGSGRATVELAPISFGEKLQPKDLAPIAAGLVSAVSGQLAANGNLTWSGDGVAGDLRVLVDQLGLTSGPAHLEQVNGVIALDRLWPPTTPPGQQLAIGLLDLGLPLTEGLTTFQLLPGPILDVSQLQWRFAGGITRAEPFSLGSPLEGTNVTLRAEQLDLGPLLELTRLDGLTGEGSLDGVLPILLSEGAAIIENGELAATGPGVLRYASGAAPAALQAGGEGVGLLLQALENFHYEALKITLDGRTDAAMDIGLHLGGANPDLYDGHPIEFNLDLEGEFGNILRQGVASYQIPDRVRERMQGFGR